MIRKLLFLSATFFLTLQVFAQDTLVLMNGRTIAVMTVDLLEYRIAYRKIPKDSGSKTTDSQTVSEKPSKKKKPKIKTMDPERVFSIQYRDGSERIMYMPDSLDPLEFSQEEMRMFIKGEQDATKYYKNNLNKGIGFGLGVGAGFLGFYGLVVPPLYATIMGSFTPNLDKRLKKQNELEESKMILDKSLLPVLPVAKAIPPDTDSEYQLALKKYESELKNYNQVQKNYENALKNHPRQISFSDTKFLERNEYRSGYERKARDRKIRNAMLSGLAGFVLIAVGIPIIY